MLDFLIKQLSLQFQRFKAAMKTQQPRNVFGRLEKLVFGTFVPKAAEYFF